MFCEQCGKQIIDGSQFCELCGAKQSEVKSTPSFPSVASAKDANQKIKQWLTQKNLLGLAALLIAISLFYYFLIRPIQEKQAYEDCFKALNETGLINSITSTSEKNFRIDSCVKSRGAEAIRERYEAEKNEREAEVKRKEDQEIVEREAKKLSYDQYKKLSMSRVNVESRDDTWSKTMILRGTITNSNSFDIQHIRLRTRVSSDSDGKNKIDEQDCEINNFIIYANSSKKFEAYCVFQSGYSRTALLSAEKAL